jgi:hypothetical protein
VDAVARERTMRITSQSHWLRNRAMTLQQSCFDAENGKISDQKSFALYLRYETTHQRAFTNS